MSLPTSVHNDIVTGENSLTSFGMVQIPSATKDIVQENNINKEALYSTGYVYFGKGDYSQALSWFRKAAHHGSSQAQKMIGDMYLLGLGAEYNIKKALTWYYRSAENDRNKDAQNRIGEFYQFGIVVPKNIQRAIAWYKKASYQGNPSAQYNLAWTYESEQEVKDLQRAANWYRIAADNGDKEAELDLKRLNEQGYHPTDEEKVNEEATHDESMVDRSLDSSSDDDQINVEEPSTSTETTQSHETKTHKKSSKKSKRKKAKKLEKMFQLKLTIYKKNK